MAKLLVISEETYNYGVNFLGDVVDTRDNDKITSSEILGFDIVFIGGMTKEQLDTSINASRTRKDFDIEGPQLPKYTFTTVALDNVATSVEGIYIKPEFVEEE